MVSAKNRKVVRGSERTALRGAKVSGEIDPLQNITLTLLLRSISSSSDHSLRGQLIDTQKPVENQYLSREEFALARGADPADLEKIDVFAHEHGLTITQTDISRRTVQLTGSVASLCQAFGVKLKNYKTSDLSYRGRTGPIYLPTVLAGIVQGVFGFDNRPAASPHYRILESELDGEVVVATGYQIPGNSKQTVNRKSSIKNKAQKGQSKSHAKQAVISKKAANLSFTPLEVAKLYNFPPNLDGQGQCIALIELNNTLSRNQLGSGFDAADLNKYFKQLSLPTPVVTAIGVDGGGNFPGVDPNADVEVTLDIEVAGAIAPRAKIAVYFAPNTDQGFIDAISTAIHDNVRKPSVVSISWGGPEDTATKQFLDGLNQVFQDAAALGVTICCASGDDGSADESPTQWDGKPHVDFPSSSPFALGCGGTKLNGSGTTIDQEVVWNEGEKGGAGGGGVSNIFALPTYQAQAKVPKSPKGKRGRGVPDVSGDADPATGYQVFVGGRSIVVGGTSAVAPLWAGLLALINQRLVGTGSKKTVGFLNPFLYQLPASATVFHDITGGNNDLTGRLKGKYAAKAGWDACTGLGTVDGAALLKALGG